MSAQQLAISPPPRPRSKRERRYLIRDASGALVAVHVRIDGPRGKDMPWEGPDGSQGLGGRPAASLPLYGSEEVFMWPLSTPILVTEGEKAMEALSLLGFSVLGTYGADVTPTVEAVQPIAKGRGFILWPDHDEPGRSHMARVAQVLYAAGAGWVHAIDTTTLDLPKEGWDAADLVPPVPSPISRERFARLVERVHAFVNAYARVVPRSPVVTPTLRLVVSGGRGRGRDQLDAETLKDLLAGVRPLTTGGYKARCPAHEDKVASLSVRDGDDGKLLLRCHAGCSFEDVMGALA